MRALLALFGAALGFAALSPAAAQTLVTTLSNHRVLIGSNYTGAQIGLFGVIERDARSTGRADPYDIVVTVSGPRRHLVVREKERQGPFWLNNEQRRFIDAPGYLSVLTTRPLAEMGSEEDARRLRLGLRNILTPPGAALSFDTGETNSPTR